MVIRSPDGVIVGDVICMFVGVCKLVVFNVNAYKYTDV